MTSIIAGICCCGGTNPCAVHGSIKITWQFQWSYLDSAKYYQTHTCCVYNEPGCTIPPFSCEGPVVVDEEDCAIDTDFTRCSCYLFQGNTDDCSWVSRYRYRGYQRMESPLSLTFPYVSSNTVTGLGGGNWIYSPDSGVTTTESCLGYSFAQVRDVYSAATKVVCTKECTTGAELCYDIISWQFGTASGNYEEQVGSTVEYWNRGYYYGSPSAFSLRNQTPSGIIRGYSIDTVAGVRTFRMYQGGGTQVYSLDITGMTIEQIRSTLDTQTSQPVICNSYMAGTGPTQVATRGLPGTILEDRGLTTVPTYAGGSVDVFLFQAGSRTVEWWQTGGGPSWNVSIKQGAGAYLKTTDFPCLAFSTNGTPEDEALFCLGYERTLGSIEECGNPPQPGGACFNDLCDTELLQTWVVWGTRTVPIGSAKVDQITSDDLGTSLESTDIWTEGCDYSTYTTVCCPEYSPPCYPGEVTQVCHYDYQCNKYASQGMFKLERIV